MSQITTLVTILTLCSIASPRLVQAAPPTDAKIQQRLKDFVEKDKKAPGLVVGLIDKQGSRVLAYGKRRSGGAEDVDGDTIFEIGSITKVFTTLLLQEMVDGGELKLEDPIGKLLPASVKAPSRNGKEITLLDLATHSSGLPRLPGNLTTWHVVTHMDNPYADYTVKQLYDFLSSYKLPRDIGSKYEYSNLGVGLLGHALALKAATNYESVILDRVCRPLQMTSTRITLSPELHAREATGHSEAGKPVSNWDNPTLAGCGSLRSSVNDMLKFLSASMAVTPTPLSNSIAKTHAPQRPADLGQQIGLGWHITPDGIRWHNGGTGGYRSFIAFNEPTHRGVVVLCNSANEVDQLGRFILGSAHEHTAVPIDAQILDKYVGKYKLAPGAILTISREADQFFAQLTGQEKILFFPESETDFFTKVVDAQLTFVVENGMATAVILHQNGFDQKAPRMK